MMENSLCPLEWDSKHFGIKSGKYIITPEVTNENVLETLKMNNYSFLTINNINNRAEVNYLLGKNTSAFLVDTIISFQKNIQNAVKSNDNSSIRIINKSDRQIINAIKILSERIFVHSRFFNDPNIDNSLARQVYSQWIENALDSEEKFLIAIANKNEEVSGFLLYSIFDNQVTIELIGVDTHIHSKGCGRKLFEFVETNCVEQNIEHLFVGTQQNNINAINFYNHMECKMKQITSIYHLWGREEINEKSFDNFDC